MALMAALEVKYAVANGCSATYIDSCVDVGENSEDCESEWDNAELNGDYSSFYARCNSETAFLERCLRCCETCNLDCGTGYMCTTLDIDGEGKEASYPGAGIENCMEECNNRDGCTSYEYNHGSDENYKCQTYTGGESNIQSDDQCVTWTSCIKTDA